MSNENPACFFFFFFSSLFPLEWGKCGHKVQGYTAYYFQLSSDFSCALIWKTQSWSFLSPMAMGIVKVDCKTNTKWNTSLFCDKALCKKLRNYLQILFLVKKTFLVGIQVEPKRKISCPMNSWPWFTDSLRKWLKSSRWSNSDCGIGLWKEQVINMQVLWNCSLFFIYLLFGLSIRQLLKRTALIHSAI